MINTDDKTKEALDAVLSQIDFNTLKASEVLADLVSNTRALAFRLLVGSALLEEIAKRDQAETTDAPEAALEHAQEEAK
jgi:antitoxin component of RelBE/YafQ-DinJ toxin-antitoxin module